MGANSVWHEVEGREWCRGGNGPREPGGVEAQGDYAGFVYFHPFIQRIFFDPASHAVSVWCRTDIEKAEIDLRPDTDKRAGKTLVLEVARIELHYFEDIGVALLLLEVASETAMSLDTVHDLLDRFRRAYPPYWGPSETRNGEFIAGHYPARVSWSDGGQSAGTNVGAFTDTVRESSQSPVDAHWRHLLEPIVFEGYPLNGGTIVASQLGDDRIPFMAWLALAQPETLTRADWVRLAFADESGDRFQLPYARSFLESFEAEHCYDRFWDHATPGGEGWMSTRFLTSGYAFLMVGRDDSASGDAQFFTGDGEQHFRRHYLQLGRLVHLQRAALLAIAHDLTLAVERLKGRDISGPGRREFFAAVRGDLTRLLRFTHRYWFHEVTGQTQGQELFERWRAHLGVDRLYGDVTAEAQAINQFLDADDQRRQADVTTRLTYVATAGLFISIVVGVWGSDTVMKSLTDCVAWVPSWVFWPIVVSFLALILLTFAAKGVFAAGDCIGRWVGRSFGSVCGSRACGRVVEWWRRRCPR
ncbi:hypothetical protein [Endothiovibrio diazotrophicus]